jgi:hypothetical protein
VLRNFKLRCGRQAGKVQGIRLGVGGRYNVLKIVRALLDELGGGRGGLDGEVPADGVVL